ncbi:MAG TPA: hypothetical protein VGV89_01175 [Thermoplasmata archaeon]|nr:hypothetical protein [Thermoplasmata archaeon]
MVAPAAIGSGAAPIVLKAPYKGSSTGLFNSNAQVSCGHSKIVKSAFFSTRTAAGGFEDSGLAPGCRVAPGAANYGSATGEFALLVPVRLAAGLHHIVVNLTVTSTETTSLTPGKCATSTASVYDCYNVAEAYVFGQAALYDATNGTTFGSTNSWPGFVNLTFNQTSCTMGACTVSGSGGSGGTFNSTAHIQLFVNATVRGGQSWSIQVIVYGGVLAEIDSFGSHVVGGIATATENVATLGNGARITAISLT